MATLILIYIFCVILGLAYALIGTLLGHSGMDTGGHDFGGHDMGHDLSSGEVSFSPFSPIVISSFIASFGAGGLVARYAFEITGIFNVLVALIAGIIVGACVFYFFLKVFRATQSSSEARVSDLAGMTAEVITPIADSGLGEIAYILRGSRYTSPAKSQDGTAISKMKAVRIIKIVGSTAVVEPLKDEPQTHSEP